MQILNESNRPSLKKITYITVPCLNNNLVALFGSIVLHIQFMYLLVELKKYFDLFGGSSCFKRR